jgi:uncharacterized membrane protein YqjE
MNAAMQAAPPPRGTFSLLAAMTRTRLELAGLEFEAHLLASIGALVMGAAAVVLTLIAFGFIGVAVIALFWDTHRVAATLAATSGYLLLAGTVAAYARAKWNARPAPFAATLHELELDRDAVHDFTQGIS